MTIHKKLTISSAITVLLTFPMIAFAIPGSVPNFSTVMFSILNLVWPIFIGFAILMFIVAGIFFLIPGKHGDGRNLLIWGAVGVVVGILAFSLPLIIGNSLGTGI